MRIYVKPSGNVTWHLAVEGAKVKWDGVLTVCGVHVRPPLKRVTKPPVAFQYCGECDRKESGE